MLLHTINFNYHMKKLSKLTLLAFLVAVSFEACTKNNNSVTPKAAAITVNKANSPTNLLRRDTITPNVKRDTITPIKIKINLPLIKRDTITPNY